MEEWAFVDERDLQNWKGGMVCMTCQHFAYGVDQHRTAATCNIPLQAALSHVESHQAAVLTQRVE